MSAMKYTRLLAVSLVFPLAACSGDDGTGPDESQLSAQASMEIFSELMVAVSQAIGQAMSGGAAAAVEGAAQAPLASVMEDFNVDAPCESGGSVSVRGTTGGTLGQSGTGTISVTYTQTPRGCKVQTSHGAFVVDGDPNLTGAYSATYSNWQPVGDFTYSFKGGYRFTGAQSGTCRMEMSYRMNPSTGKGRSVGTLCGVEIDQTF